MNKWNRKCIEMEISFQTETNLLEIYMEHGTIINIYYRVSHTKCLMFSILCCFSECHENWPFAHSTKLTRASFPIQNSFITDWIIYTKHNYVVTKSIILDDVDDITWIRLLVVLTKWFTMNYVYRIVFNWILFLFIIICAVHASTVRSFVMNFAHIPMRYEPTMAPSR